MAGDIKDYETNTRLRRGRDTIRRQQSHQVKHKVDFRVLHNDSSYELIESKGVETDDYKWRRKFLEAGGTQITHIRWSKQNRSLSIKGIDNMSNMIYTVQYKEKDCKWKNNNRRA